MIKIQIRYLAATFLMLLTGFACSGQALHAKPPKPNIIIIFTDDQGYADLGCFGSTKNKTPNLDRLAKNGTRFTNFYAQPVCGPSRSAILTGRYPTRSKGWSMPADEITFAELLKGAGYQTACIGKWDVSNRKPFADRLPNAQGFDYYFGTLGGNDWGVVDFYENNKRMGETADMSGLTKLYTDKAIDYLQNKCDTKKPFVLYLAHTMMHMNIDASPEFLGKSKGGLYGDVVEEFDTQTGRLLDVLKTMGLTDNTIIIYTSDNGPWNQKAYIDVKRKEKIYTNWKEKHARFKNDDIFWGDNGPLRNGKGSCYEGGVRVPLIVSWPGQVPMNKVSDAIFATIDFLPTFAALAGVDTPKDRKIDGVDQTKLILGKSKNGARDNFFYINGYRKGKWKYLAANHAIWDYARGATGQDEEALYDLSKDIGEKNNLIKKHPKIAAELRAYMLKELEGASIPDLKKIIN